MSQSTAPLTSPFRAAIRRHNGVPMVFVNDRPCHLGMVGVNCQTERDIAFLKTDPASICLLWIPQLCRIDDTPDYDAIARPFHDILERFPDALLGTVIEVHADDAWVRSHPDEMTLYDPPVTDWSAVRPGRTPDPSWASTQWQSDSARYYHNVVAFLHKTFQGRVVLYQIGGGSNGENYPIVDPIHSGLWQCADYSRPMLQWFRERLRDYYAGDVDRLRTAWSDPAVTFDTAAIPDRNERLATEWFSFRSPRRGQTADFYRAYSEAVEQCSLAWAGAIKKATERGALVSCPIGSELDCGINAFTLHHLIKNTHARCLASTDIDFFQSPSSYIHRDLGFGDTTAMIPTGMINLHGKGWLRDFDSRTSVIGTDLTKDPPSALWRNPRTPWEDVQLLKRDAGYSMLKGGAWFWQEHRDGMYHLPEHIAIAGCIQTVAQGLLHADRTCAPGLAVVTDSAANFHLANSNRLIYAMNYAARQRHWNHTGMAGEVYELDDISHPDFPPHKVIMVTNAFAITDAQVAAITDHARKHSATVIWLVAPGLITPEAFDLQRVSDITGFAIRAVDAEALPQLTMIPTDHAYSQAQLPDGNPLQKFGAGPLGFDDSAATAIGPLFYVDPAGDPDITVLALTDALCEPGLVVRTMDGYTSVYCAAPYVHYSLLAQIGRHGGAHCYAAAGDLVHANRSLLLINTISKGEKQLTWPEEVNAIHELYDDTPVATDSAAWSCPMKAFETQLFYAGPEDTAEKIRSLIHG